MMPATATKLQVSAAVAEGDGATGWVLALTNVCHWLVGLYRDDAQQEIFGADPDARVRRAHSAARDAARGRRARRERALGVGLRLAARDVGLVGALDKDVDGNVTEHVLALIPMSEMTAQDTSFVPDHRLLSVPKGIENEYPTEHTDPDAIVAARREGASADELHRRA